MQVKTTPKSSKFGRIYSEDDRDQNFLVKDVIKSEKPYIPEKKWWADGWHGNQGSHPYCVAYSWSHWVEDGPVIQDIVINRSKPMFDPVKFYNECQLRDEWAGTDYDGTSVRAGAKILKELGVISEYRWAFNIEDIIEAVTYLGTMSVGTTWYSGMMKPNSRGLLRPKGKDLGGHAYLINGVDRDKELFRIKNSWGTNWGQNSMAYITFKDFEKLMKEYGEACIAFQNKVDTVPLLEDLKKV